MADNTTPPPDVTPPVLDNGWGTFSPAMDGRPRYTQPPAPGTKGPLARPTVSAIVVAPGSLEAAADGILAKANTATNTYTDLRTYINANKGWVFDVADPTVLTSTQYIPYGDTAYAADPWDPHADWTQAWAAESDNLLLAVADTIELAGSFLDTVNNAGQFYTQADKESEMPGFGESRPTGANVPSTPA